MNSSGFSLSFPRERLPTVRLQSALLFGVLTILVASLLLGSAAYLVTSEAQRERASALDQIAHTVARELADGMEERKRLVNLLARDRELWSHGLDHPVARAALERLRASAAATAWVGVADPGGLVRNATDGILIGESVRARAWFVSGLHEPYLGDVHDAVLLADRLPPRISNEPLRLVDFASPIVEDGRVIGVLGVHGDWAWASNLIDRALPPRNERNGLEVLILDRANRVLLPAAGQVRQATGSTLAANIPVFPTDDRRALGWRVLVQQPAAQAYATTRNGVINMAAVGVAAVLLGTLAAWLLSGLISRPLEHLARDTLDIDPGKPLPSALPEWRNREIATLAHAFQVLARRLLSSREALERGFFEQMAALQTAHRQLEQRSADQEAMLDSHLAGIIRLRELRMTWINGTLARMFHYRPEVLEQSSLRMLFPDELSFLAVYRQVSAQLRSDGFYRAQVMMQRCGGAPVWVDLSVSSPKGPTGETLWMLHDISALKVSEQAAERMAFIDDLTGLPNRVLLLDRLQQALAVNSRLGQQVCVCFLDLDGFKAVNDTHGHAAGDEVLQLVAGRLTSQMRQSDTVARLSGDEFVMVLTAVERSAECIKVVERLIERIAAPLTLANGATVEISVSIGLAMSPAHGKSPDVLLRRADQAMYTAKTAGKNRFALFQPQGRRQAERPADSDGDGGRASASASASASARDGARDARAAQDTSTER